MKYLGTPYDLHDVIDLASEFNLSLNYLMSVEPLIEVDELESDFSLRILGDEEKYFFQFGENIGWEEGSTHKLVSINDKERYFMQSYEHFSDKASLRKIESVYGVMLSGLFFPITSKEEGGEHGPSEILAESSSKRIVDIKFFHHKPSIIKFDDVFLRFVLRR